MPEVITQPHVETALAEVQTEPMRASPSIDPGNGGTTDSTDDSQASRINSTPQSCAVRVRNKSLLARMIATSVVLVSLTGNIAQLILRNAAIDHLQQDAAVRCINTMKDITDPVICLNALKLLAVTNPDRAIKPWIEAETQRCKDLTIGAIAEVERVSTAPTDGSAPTGGRNALPVDRSATAAPIENQHRPSLPRAVPRASATTATTATLAPSASAPEAHESAQVARTGAETVTQPDRKSDQRLEELHKTKAELDKFDPALPTKVWWSK